MKIELNRGDVFASSNPQSLGRMINFVQRLKSKDNESTYGHTGIIVDGCGTTIEAVWKIETQNLFEDYKGQKVLIARWKGMDKDNFLKGFGAITEHFGATYPYYRLFMHALGIGKFIHFKTPVCSEFTQKFLVSCGAKTLAGNNWWGINPDDLVDEWRISEHFDIIFEGVI